MGKRWLATFLGASLMLVVSGCSATPSAQNPELVLDEYRDNLSLNGRWEVLPGHSESNVYERGVTNDIGPWRTVTVPGNLVLPPKDAAKEERKKFREKTIKTLQSVWATRLFQVSPEQAKRDAVLKWGGVRFGATAWINGKQVAHHTPVGPNTVILPAGLLKAGENLIVLKVPGWGGVPKSKSGYPLTPTGGATQSWGGKGPAIQENIYLEFYDRVYLKQVLAIPNIARSEVTFRMLPVSNGNPPKTLRIEAMVTPEGTSDELLLYRVEKTFEIQPGKYIDLTVPVLNPKLWTPQSPKLYSATVTATANHKLCDTVRFTFGFREFGVKYPARPLARGYFALNGKRVWLRGANLVHEWDWGDQMDTREKAMDYFITQARAQNLNCFRTHTIPPPARILDLTDEEGMMILAEFPLLYNHANFEFTPEEYDIFHKNAMLDATNWVTRMWNHPSIVMWVLSNESPHDNAWESGPYYRAVKALDPTRPAMRTGDLEPNLTGTPDMVDVHRCFNVVRGPEGELHVQQARLRNKVIMRPLGNTEYMNRMWNASHKWLGVKNHLAWPVVEAQCAAEHTEVMRRLNYDCLLPYMYRWWTPVDPKKRWKERTEYLTPMAAALHSAMSPVLASLDVFDANYLPGQKVTCPVVMINELHKQVDATVQVIITPDNPLWIPKPESIKEAVWKKTFNTPLGHGGPLNGELTFTAPQKEGHYFLAAILRRKGDRPVVSQRFFRVIDVETPAATLADKAVVILGADDAARAWAKGRKLNIAETLDGQTEAEVVLVWDAAKLTGPQALHLRAFAEEGGKVVVLNQPKWDRKELADIAIQWPEFKHMNPAVGSRAHRYKNGKHPVFAGVQPEILWRWNGLPGQVADQPIIGGKDLEKAKKLLWVSNEKYPVMISLPVGKGEIIFSQLQIRHRLDRNAKTYDPAAEKMLVNLLAK